jgi:hypothetical protein
VWPIPVDLAANAPRARRKGHSVRSFPGPTQTVEPTQAAEPSTARAARPAIRRRLLRYALAAASIVVAAALADHWNVLPRVGATTSSSSAQVGGPSQHPQLLPPLDQPPVMHFNTARGG